MSKYYIFVHRVFNGKITIKCTVKIYFGPINIIFYMKGTKKLFFHETLSREHRMSRCTLKYYFDLKYVFRRWVNV
jgi:hypothetical protein